MESINFPGQFHRWRLSQLLQKGSKKARNSLLNVSRSNMYILITVNIGIKHVFFSGINVHQVPPPDRSV